MCCHNHGTDVVCRQPCRCGDSNSAPLLDQAHATSFVGSLAGVCHTLTVAGYHPGGTQTQTLPCALCLTTNNTHTHTHRSSGLHPDALSEWHALLTRALPQSVCYSQQTKTSQACSMVPHCDTTSCQGWPGGSLTALGYMDTQHLTCAHPSLMKNFCDHATDAIVQAKR